MYSNTKQTLKRLSKDKLLLIILLADFVIIAYFIGLATNVIKPWLEF